LLSSEDVEQITRWHLQWGLAPFLERLVAKVVDEGAIHLVRPVWAVLLSFDSVEQESPWGARYLHRSLVPDHELAAFVRERAEALIRLSPIVAYKECMKRCRTLIDVDPGALSWISVHAIEDGVEQDE